MDDASRRWVEGLRADGSEGERTVVELRGLLLEVARHDAARRSERFGEIDEAELDGLAEAAAADALDAVLARLDAYRGECRFTTWATKLAIFQVSRRFTREIWRRNVPAAEDFIWDRLPERLVAGPSTEAGEMEMLALLGRAIGEDLTERQREVFVAVAINEVPIDLVVLRERSTRGAVYETLYEARRTLRRRLEAAGHTLWEGGAR
jgi:RNA polymerase sigma-70 factor, ECF subfamily